MKKMMNVVLQIPSVLTTVLLRHVFNIFVYCMTSTKHGRLIDHESYIQHTGKLLYITQLYIYMYFFYFTDISRLILFDFWYLAPRVTIFQLYHDDQFQWWNKPEYPERTIDHGQANGKLYHLRLRVECTLFVIYKAGRELTPYW